MKYQVVLFQDGDYARLEYDSMEEAVMVRRSFVNYGKCQEVRIEYLVDEKIPEGEAK